MKHVRQIPKGHRRDKPLVLKGERLIEETKNVDGEPALTLVSSKGWYILREWDKFYGWGDRAYRTLGECTRHAQGPLKTEANMARVRKNAAKGAEHVVVAFLDGRKARSGSRPDYKAGARYETDGKSLVQWGSVIARKVNGSIEITDAGWRTKTTMAMLNSVLRRTAANASIYQKSHEWYLSTPGGMKKWVGKAVVKLDAATVEANRSKRRRSPVARKKSARGSVSLGLSCLKNLHTARERAFAKKLITRYYLMGIAAIKKGQKDRAAHAYGALAAIKRLARFELPHAQVVSSLASMRMDGLRYQVKVVKGGRNWRWA